jgi:multiple sugar transport system permease protein
MPDLAGSLKREDAAGRMSRRRVFDPQRLDIATLAIFLLPAIFLLAVFRLAPIAIGIVGSFMSQKLTGQIVFAGLENYLSFAEDPDFWNSVKITLLFNIIVNPLQVVVAFCMALLVFKPGRGVTFFRVAFFMPMTMSTALVALLWSLLLDPNMGPINALLAETPLGRQGFFHAEGQALATMIGIATWKGSGYWMIFLLAGLYRISGELYEAADVDGASAWQQLRFITLPQMKRTFAFVFVADTTVNLLFFAPVYVITRGGPNGATDTLMFRAYESSFTFIDWGRALSLSVVLLILIGLIAAVQFRLFRQSEAE